MLKILIISKELLPRFTPDLPQRICVYESDLNFVKFMTLISLRVD